MNRILASGNCPDRPLVESICGRDANANRPARREQVRGSPPKKICLDVHQIRLSLLTIIRNQDHRVSLGLLAAIYCSEYHHHLTAAMIAWLA
jgi:hypothetical protein